MLYMSTLYVLCVVFLVLLSPKIMIIWIHMKDNYEDMMKKLKRSILKHENYRKYPYLDTVGKLTIGIGYNLSDRGIDDEWIKNAYTKDVIYLFRAFERDYKFFNNLNNDRKIVLIDMAFMGYKKISLFKNMIGALEKEDYELAANEMLKSTWAYQVKGRATELAEAMRTGVYNI